MLIPSLIIIPCGLASSLSRRVNANSQQMYRNETDATKLIKKGEC